MLTLMTCCPYCGKQATMRIVSFPELVCFDHALEFWTGLLGYAHHSSDACVKHDRECTCPSCEELSASDLRAIAVAAAHPSPGDHEHTPIRLAS